MLRGFEEMLVRFQQDVSETGRVMREMKTKAEGMETLAANRKVAAVQRMPAQPGLCVCAKSTRADPVPLPASAAPASPE